jgi:hypothetical protein
LTTALPFVGWRGLDDPHSKYRATMKNVFDFCRLQLLMLVLLAGVVLVSGCSTCKPGQDGKAKAYNIQINLDPPLKGKCEVVDVVGVNPAGLSRWQEYSMSSYWKDGDPLRRDSKSDRFTFSFAEGQPLTQTLSVTNAQWNVWKAKGVTHLVVLAELPGPPDEKRGDANTRRLTLPLGECHWAKGTSTLNVLVQQSGIQVLTPIRQ